MKNLLNLKGLIKPPTRRTRSRHIDRGTHCECWSCRKKFKKGRKTCPYCRMPR